MQLLRFVALVRAGHLSRLQFAIHLASSCNLQEQSNKAESLVRFYDGIVNAAEALGRLAGEELRGAQAEHLEEEAAAKVYWLLTRHAMPSFMSCFALQCSNRLRKCS